jgi:2-dehydropantoate 2-reductase
MQPVQWAKLLLNLGNAVNALADLPLRDQLAQRSYRRCTALAQGEGLDVMQAAGIEPAPLMGLAPRRLVRVMTLPDALFRRLARRTLAVDPLARSSMWEDLQAARPTEVDELNGEVVRLAQRLGRTAPVNARLVALVHAAESGGRRHWSGPDLLAELRAAEAG